MSGRLGPWFDSIRERPVGPLVFMLVFAAGLGAVVYGAYWANPGIRIQELDAGPVTRFAIGRVEAYPALNVYVVGLADGRLRAIDGIVADSGCAVELLPEEPSTREQNPAGQPGAYRDPCTGALWALTGDGHSGTDRPLRTFELFYERDEAGVQHAWVEVLGDRQPKRQP